MAGALKSIIDILVKIFSFLPGGGFLGGLFSLFGFGKASVPVAGAQAGGVFSQPALRVIAEREPEVVGSPNVIVRAFSATLQANGGLAVAGAGGGPGGTINGPLVSITAFDPNGLRKTVEEEVIPMITDALRQNRLQARTKFRSGLS